MDEALRLLLDVAAEVGLSARIMSEDEFADLARPAFLREGLRFQVAVCVPGSPPASSWWPDETAARSRYERRIGELAETPGARVTLIDEVEQMTLAVWPEEAGRDE